MTLWDFSDWTDFTNDFCGTAGVWQNNSNPAETIDTNAHDGALYVTPPGFTSGKSFSAFARVKFDNTANAHCVNLFVRGDNGNSVSCGIGDQTQARVMWSTGAKSICNSFSWNDQFTAVAVTNRWVWIRISYSHISKQVDYYYVNSDSTSKPASEDWIFVGSAAIEIDIVSTLGIVSYRNTANPPITVVHFADDLEIVETLRTTDLDLGTAEIQEIYAYSKIGGGGRAQYTIADPGLVNKDTIQNNIGKAITITDLTYGKNHFKGEISKFNELGDNHCVLEVKEASQKALDNETNHDPILYGGLARHRKTDRLFDKDASFDTAWGDNAYAITMEKSDDKRMKVYPDDVTFSPTPDNEQGVPENCYFNDGGTLLANSIIARHEDDGLSADIYFDLYLERGALLTPMELLLKFRLSSIQPLGSYHGGAGGTPEIFIYDFDEPGGGGAAGFESLKDYQTDDGIHRSNAGTLGMGGYVDFTEVYSYSVNLPPNVDRSIINYMSEVDCPAAGVHCDNDSGFAHFQMLFRIDHGQLNTNEKYQIALQYAHLDISTSSDFDFPIVPKVGFSRLHTDTTSTLLVFENTGWGNIQMPAEDGFSDGDRFFITKWIDGIIADCFTDSGISILLDWDVTDSDIYTIVEDLSVFQLFDVLQKFLSMFNGLWYYDRVNTIFARSVDTLEVTGVTLTEKDVENFRDGTLKYTEDGDALAEKLTIEGRNVEYTIDPLSPEYNLDLDTASVIVRDDSIISTREAKRRAEGMRYQFENTIKEIRIPLNFTDPAQSYANLELGEKVSYVSPINVGSKYNFSDNTVDGNAPLGQMVITEWTYRWGQSTGYMELIDLTLQRRYS